MFVDHVTIFVKAGDGGNGAVAFHREKYVSAGGPDGGDGGRGGNVVFRVDPGCNTLLAFRYRRKFIAGDGGNGKGAKFHGADVKGSDLRAGAALVIAALAADGESTVSGLEYIDRGYENFLGKLKSLGADIKRV